MADKSIGSITPSKYADLALVDRDVLTINVKDLFDTKVLWTMFKGMLLYNTIK